MSKSTSHHANAENAANAQCPVCLDNAEDVCRTRCGHFFCERCIRAALERRGKCPLCRASASLYSVMRMDSRCALENTEVASPLDNCVFVQGGKVGLASYHLSREKCFVAYKNGVIPQTWKLDDGTTPPEEKRFTEVSYDERRRVFRGVVTWDAVPFALAKRWEYSMEFDEGFNRICGGTCEVTNVDGSTYSQRFGRQLFYRRVRSSMVGNVYVSRGYGVGCASIHFSTSSAWLNLSDNPQVLIHSIPSSPPPTIPFINTHFDTETRSFTGDLDLSSCPFGLDHRWECRLDFDEAFSAVESGYIRSYSAEGSLLQTRRFSSPRDALALGLKYVLHEIWDSSSES